MKLELREITESHLMRDRPVMISSTMPSAKYSCSRSPLMVWNGRTAIEGLVGNARAGRVGSGGAAARSPRRPSEVSVGAADVVGMSDPAIRPSLRGDIDPPTCEPSAGRRLQLPRRPPASARSRPAVQSALDRAASAGHSYACSSGSPLESKLQQPQLPRSEPDEQPNESSQLGHAACERRTHLRIQCNLSWGTPP